MAPLIGFLFGYIGSIPVAGPISLLVLAYGLQGRFRGALALAAGGALAEGGYAFLAFWGLSRLLERYPQALPASRAAGALALLGLGLAFASGKAQARDQGEVPAGEPADQAPQADRRRGAFALGFSLTALNPTLLVTWTAAVSTLSASKLLASSFGAAVPFAVGASTGIVAWFATLLVLVRRYRGRFGRSSIDRAVRGVGLGLMALGLYFAVDFLRYLSR